MKFTACPIFICCKIIVPLWIEARTAYKWVINVKPFCMLSVYLLLHFRQSFISVAVCISKYRHWKGKGFRAEYSPQEEDFDRNGLPPDLSTVKGYCTTFADEQRKGANDGIGKLIYRRLMIDQIKFYTATMKKAPLFCSFIKKLYLCVSGVISLMQNNKEPWNRNGCHLVTQFPSNPNNCLILR